MANPNLLNLSSVYGGANTISVASTNTTLATCPSDHVYKVNSIQISSNNDPSGVFTVSIDSGIYAQIQMNDKSITDVIINKPLYLTESKELKVKSDVVGGSATCTVVYESLTDQ